MLRATLFTAFTFLAALTLACPQASSDKSASSDDDDKKKKKKKNDDDDDEKKKDDDDGKKKDDDDGKKKDDDGAAASASASATAPAPAAEASFFAGDIPAGVKQKPIKGWAIAAGVLLFQPLEGYSGGRLPGNEYMAMRPDQAVSFRVMTSTAVVKELACKDLAATIGMAPARGKDVVQKTPGTVRKVGSNGFVAREGSCEATGPKGKLAVHYIDIEREDAEGSWHYAVIVTLPADADDATRDEAMAWARSVEFNGRNAMSL